MLAMQRGRHGQRYVLGGENITLAELLTIVSDIGGHKALRFGVPSVVAEAAAVTLEFVADHITHKPPSATVEGVRIARRSRPVSIEKSHRELGYSPRSILPALEETVASIIGQPR